MLFPYMKLYDGTEVAHTQVLEGNCVRVHFERSNADGYCFATCELPQYRWKHVEGFAESEMEFLTEYMQSNAHLIYKGAQRT